MTFRWMMFQNCWRQLGSAVAASAFVAVTATPVHGEVLEASATSFTVRTTAAIARSAAAVYDDLTQHVGDWWDPSHTYSGRASNLSIVPKPGGCFCEQLPDGGVEHMTVIYAERGKMLRLRGGLGPLQALTVTGVWTVTLQERNGQTTIESTYAVGGYTKDGLNALAPLVDRVLAEQIARLQQFSTR